MSSTINAVLTQEEAKIRARQIKKVDYQLSFSLTETQPQYTGSVEVQLEMASDAIKISDSLFMDFSGGGGIQKILLNGKTLSYEYQNGSKIKMPLNDFLSGKNTLHVEFSHPYGNSGIGLHRTKDQADQKSYIYTDFEPYHANHAFPLFDQPDLKATYALQVEVPKDWIVISHGMESSQKEVDSTRKRWIFPAGKRFSSYLLALIAGPYHFWESKTSRGVPLRLFTRQSMVKNFEKDVKQWFEITDQGFQYFEKSFGYLYPFEKYDQILTPDYNQGAMENVGAVTFTEQYIFRTPPTPIQVLRRAETIVHELAHMWFGNLVTMRWWDDLWLNESFATYMSNLAMSYFDKKVSSADVWQHFHATDKTWAYREDDDITTHPIVGDAPDTDSAVANFDGITYGKGASVLKQLVYRMGEASFLKGLSVYFKKYAFQNATRADFLKVLEENASESLVEWEQEWLKTSGTNSVQVTLDVNKEGHIDQMVLKQFPDEADLRLRTHQTQVGFYVLNNQDELVLQETMRVRYSGKETQIKEAKGKKAPQFVFPNTGDHDFVRVVLDPASLLILETHLGKIKDPFLKQMLWQTLWTMVRHAELSAQKFVDLGILHLRHEEDLGVLQQGLDYLLASSWYLTPELKKQDMQKKEAFLWELFQSVDDSDPKKIVLFSRYLATVRSESAIRRIRDWLDQDFVKGFQIDQERRWAILFRLAANGYKQALSLIQKEQLKDSNDKGVQAAMSAEAAFSEIENKKKWWNRLLEKEPGYGKLSIEKARRIMSAFHDEDHLELTHFMSDAFFQVLPELMQKFPDKFNASFARLLFPKDCSQGIHLKVAAFLKKHPDLQVGVQKELRVNAQLHERTLKARAFSHDQFLMAIGTAKP